MTDNPVILITRPKAQAARLAQDLRELGVAPASIVIAPLSEVRTAGDPINGADHPLVAFTSENAVRAAAGLWQGPKARAYAVGDRTAEAATQAGWTAISASGRGADLAKLIAKREPAADVLWPSGQNIQPAFPTAAQDLGLHVTRRIVYAIRNVALGPEARRIIAGTTHLVLPVYSPASALRLRSALGDRDTNQTLVAISAEAADAFGTADTVIVAESPDGAAMLRAIASIFHSAPP